MIPSLSASLFGGIIEITVWDVLLIFLFAYFIYRMFFKKTDGPLIHEQEHPQIEPLEKQDMTVDELRKYNGIDDPHICFALCGKVLFLCTIINYN